MDIKTPPPQPAEVGYWANADYPGIMTTAVSQLINWAKHVGYRKLYALIIPENIKSQAVVNRLDFSFQGEVIENNKHYFKYTLNL